MNHANRRRVRDWRLLAAVPWLVVFMASAAGAEVSEARDARGSRILVAGWGEQVPGVRTADPDDSHSVAPPMATACAGAIEIDPGFAPWPSRTGAGAAPAVRPVLGVAPKTSPPRSSR